MKKRNGLLIATIATCILTACGGGGGSDSPSSSVEPPQTTNPPSNSAPTLNLDKSNLEVLENETSQIKVEYSDPDNDQVSIELINNSNSYNAEYANKTILIKANEVDSDTTSSLKVVANDGKGGVVEKEITIKIKDKSETENNPPELSVSVAELTIEEGQSSQLSIEYSDPDEDSVEISFEKSNEFFEVSMNENEVFITALEVEQTEVGILTIVATDSKDSSVKQEIVVTIENKEENSAPELSVSVAELTIEEGQSSQLSIEYSDPDEDSVEISFEKSNEFFEVSMNENEVFITALEVEQTEVGILTIVATDSKGLSDQKEVSITIENEIEEETTPPEFILIEKKETGFSPQYVMKEKTRLAIPFDLSIDEKLNKEDVKFNFELVHLTGAYYENLDLSLNVNMESQLIEIIAPEAIGDPRYRVNITVDDGYKTTTGFFTILIKENRKSVEVIPSKETVVITDLSEVELKVNARYNNKEDFSFTSIEYLYPEDAQEDLLNKSISEDGIVTLSAKSLDNEKTIVLIVFGKEGYYESGRSFEVIIKNGYTDLEKDFIDFLEEMSNAASYSAEYDAIGNFYIENYMSKSLEKLEINSTKEDYESIQLKAEEYADFNSGYFFNYSSLNDALRNAMYKINETGYYTNPEKSLSRREADIREDMAQIQEYYDRVKTNQYMSLYRLGVLFEEVNENENYIMVELEELKEIEQGKYSRYVGNEKYGSYVDGKWVFNEEYKYLVPILEKYLNIELN